MSTPQIHVASSNDNPLDLVEQIASQNEWLFDRAGEDEMHLSFPGQSEDHHLSFSWRSNVETLQLSAQLEVKVPKAKRAEIAALINIINEQLWLGHFEMWPDSGQISYRHGLLLRNSMGTPEQCEGMIDAALEACDVGLAHRWRRSREATAGALLAVAHEHNLRHVARRAALEQLLDPGTRPRS